MPESTKHYPVSIEGVKKIQAQNRQGIKPDALETVEVISGKPKEVEPEFVDVVGQISLRTLERNTKKRKDRERDTRQQSQQNARQGPRDRTQKPPDGPQNQQRTPQLKGPQRPPQQRPPQTPGETNT